jgi:hypothetical protein
MDGRTEAFQMARSRERRFEQGHVTNPDLACSLNPDVQLDPVRNFALLEEERYAKVEVMCSSLVSEAG